MLHYPQIWNYLLLCTLKLYFVLVAFLIAESRLLQSLLFFIIESQNTVKRKRSIINSNRPLSPRI